MTSQILGIHDGAGILYFDGHAEVTVPNLDVLKKLVEDNFFSEFAKPDEAALMDLNSVRRTIGYEEIHVDHGKVVEG
jgi:prepilin-type processing-associated H-X9-DG protein